MALPDKMTARYFGRYGFTAPVIVDVGVLDGTPFLYESFPEARFVLVDALEESRDAVARSWDGRIDYEFHVCALGAAPGRVRLEIDPRRLARSSAQRRAAASDALPLEHREVELRPLDALLEGRAGPFGLKIDTEGHELDVLRGATRTLRDCEFVIAEVSIKRRFENGYRFSEVIGFMARQGFEVYSFLSGLTRSPRFADVLFVPADSPRLAMDAANGGAA